MTKQETYEAGIKLLGLYLCVSALSIALFTMLNLAKLTFNERLYSTAFYSLVHPIIQMILGAVLIKKTKVIASKLDK